MAKLLEGRATAEGTREYAARMAARTAAGHFRAHLGLTLSSVGLGTYLGPDDDETDAQYREAVLRALELGVNVLDCAINYRNQRSERAVGAALATAIEQGIAAREEVVIATKGGFLSFDGGRPANPRAYLEETYFRPGIMRPNDIVAGCHVMTPRYLRDQLARSRANLGVQTIDIYYVHNPETQLGEVPRAEFLARIRAAFEALEQACAAGEIGVYGTATWNGYRVPPAEEEHLSLAELLEAARHAGGEGHHFRAVQLPYNLAMPEAAVAPTQEGRPFLDAAAAAGMVVMTSASVLQGKLTRSLPPQIEKALAGLQTDAQRAIQFVRSTPGVATALVGMKRAAHVEENLGVAAVAPAPEAIASLFPWRADVTPLKRAAFVNIVVHALGLAGAALLLKPGTPLVPIGDRLAWLAARPWQWTAGWAIWIACALAMGLYVTLLARTMRRRTDVAVAVKVAVVAAWIAVAIDVVGDGLWMTMPGRVADTSAFLRFERALGAVGQIGANGLYSLAVLLLSFAMPTRAVKLLGAATFLAGLGIVAAGVTDSARLLMFSTGPTIGLFCVWTAVSALVAERERAR